MILRRRIARHRALRQMATITRAEFEKKGSITSGISGRSKTPEPAREHQKSSGKAARIARRATMKIFCAAHYRRVFPFVCHIYTQFLFFKL
jgi:hypothetical protein